MMKPWVSNLLYRLAVNAIGVLICIFLVAPIMLIVGDRTSPYTYLKGEVTTQDAVPGQMVYVKWSGAYNRNCDGQIFRSVIDSGKTVHLLDVLPSVLTIATPGETITLPDDTPTTSGPVDETLKTTRRNVVEWTRGFVLPLGTTDGPAMYRVRSEYWCNPLQHSWPIRVNLPDIPFNVVRPAVIIIPGLQGLPGIPGPAGPTGPTGPRGPEGKQR